MKLYTLEWWAYLTKDSQYQGLDLMRSIAILMVVIWHFDSFVFRIGWIGVDLFFILSGFLIGSILLKSVESKAFSYRLYIYNRFLRIYPLYIVSVIVYMYFAFINNELNGGLLQFLVHATFMQTVFFDIFGRVISYYPVTWSLVVEVLFYIVIPFFLIPLRRMNGLWIGLVMVVIGFIVLRFWLSSTYLPNDHNWQFFLFLKPYYRIDELLFGVAVAYSAHCGSKENDRLSLFFGVVIVAMASLHIYFLPGAGVSPSMALFTRDGVFIPTVLALGFSLIVFGVYRRNLSCWWVNCIARLAYPLYLLHMFALHLTSGFVSYVFMSFVMALVASYLIEYPFIRIYKSSQKGKSACSSVQGAVT